MNITSQDEMDVKSVGKNANIFQTRKGEQKGQKNRRFRGTEKFTIRKRAKGSAGEKRKIKK